jgi:hypothetical protein
MADGTPFRRIRMADGMWEAFDTAVRRAEPELDRSKVLREFVRWYVGETDDLPRRPSPGPHRRYCFADWPDALPWLTARFARWQAMADEVIIAGGGFVDREYVGVATWLGLTGPAETRDDVCRSILTDLLSAAQQVPVGSGWRARYRDTEELRGQLSVALDSRLPPHPRSAY